MKKIILIFLFILPQVYAQRLPVNTIAQLREGFITGFHEALNEYTGEGISIYYLTDEKKDLSLLKTVSRAQLKDIQKIIEMGPRQVNFLYNALFAPDAKIAFLSFDDLEKGEDKKILHSVIIIEDTENFIDEAESFKEQFIELAQKNVVIAPNDEALVLKIKKMDLIDKIIITAPFDPERLYPINENDLFNVDIDLFSPTISPSLFLSPKKIEEYQKSHIHAALLASGMSLVLEKLKKEKKIDPITDAKSMVWKHAKKLWFPAEDRVVYFDTIKQHYESNEVERNYVKLVDIGAVFGHSHDHYLRAMKIDEAQKTVRGKDIKVAIIDQSFMEDSSKIIPNIILYESIGKSTHAKLPGPGFFLSQELVRVAPDVKIIALESNNSRNEIQKAIERALELMTNIIVIRNVEDEIARDLHPTFQKAHEKGVIFITPSYCGPEKNIVLFETLNSGSIWKKQQTCGVKKDIQLVFDTFVIASNGLQAGTPYRKIPKDFSNISAAATVAGASAMLLETKRDMKPEELKKIFHKSGASFGFGNKILSFPRALEETNRLGKKKELEAYSDKMKKHIESLIASKNKESLRDELKTCFSFSYMSERALGNHWKTLTDQEKEEFLKLLRENVVEGLVKVILKKEHAITVKGSVIKDDMATVIAFVKQKEVDIKLEFQFVKLENKWFVYNVIVDGASLLDRYKRDFQEYMKKQSFESLLNKMKKNLEKNTPTS